MIGCRTDNVSGNFYFFLEAPEEIQELETGNIVEGTFLSGTSLSVEGVATLQFTDDPKELINIAITRVSDTDRSITSVEVNIYRRHWDNRFSANRACCEHKGWCHAEIYDAVPKTSQMRFMEKALYQILKS